MQIDLARLKRAPGYVLATVRTTLDPRRLPDSRRFFRRLQDFHRDFVSPGELVFDIGANVGHYTAAFRALGASVVAVEPDPAAVKKLRRRFGRDRSVMIVAKGVSDAEGTERLYVSPQGEAYTTMSPEWVEAIQDVEAYSALRWEPSEEVSVITLDSLIDEFGVPAFVKIDVEGSELPVVRGLSRPVPALSLESHPVVHEHTMAALHHLQALGETEFMYVPGDLARRIGRAMPGPTGEWVDLEAVNERLAAASHYGDVLVRFSEVHAEGKPPRKVASP